MSNKIDEVFAEAVEALPGFVRGIWDKIVPPLPVEPEPTRIHVVLQNDEAMLREAYNTIRELREHLAPEHRENTRYILTKMGTYLRTFYSNEE